MNTDSEAAVIANDLDSLIHRVEALPPHPHYTEALTAVLKARDAVNAGRMDLHRAGMEARFATAP